MAGIPTLRACIGGVVRQKGYAYCYPTSEEVAEAHGLTTKTSITFDLGLFPRNQRLVRGHIVELSELTQTDKGWRAYGASRVTASAGE